tara:strand:- start:4312 stop:4461 length:150 start_codon:yes stop_codon:yes gene_type:complete
MSQNRRNRRKQERKPLKKNITTKDKIYGILALVLLFLIASTLVLIDAFS